MKDIFNIGQIVNTHGVRGEVKVIPLTDDINRFKKLKKVLIDDVQRNILGCKFQKDRVILKIEGIDSMDEAERYKQKYICVERSEAIKLPEDTYFIKDLVGCQVLDTYGEILGNIDEVIKTGSNDVYWIKGKKGKELLIPVLKEIVLEIDIDNKKIIIKPVREWQDED